MKKNILERYALSVCFLALLCLIIASGIGLYDIVEIINPEFTISSYDPEIYQPPKVFLKEQRNALQSLTKIIIIVLIDSIVLFIHWRIAKRARNSELANV